SRALGSSCDLEHRTADVERLETRPGGRDGVSVDASAQDGLPGGGRCDRRRRRQDDCDGRRRDTSTAPDHGSTSLSASSSRSPLQPVRFTTAFPSTVTPSAPSLPPATVTPSMLLARWAPQASTISVFASTVTDDCRQYQPSGFIRR